MGKRASVHEILGGLHVEPAHATELLDLARREQALDRKGAKGTAVTAKGEHVTSNKSDATHS